MTASNRPNTLDFHFDPLCPWAFQTSLWIRDVRDQLGFELNWRFFSLETINLAEGKNPPWSRPWSYGWSLMRVAAFLRRESMELCDKWYLGAGTALHLHGRKAHSPQVAREIATEIGLDPGVVDEALADQSTHDEVRHEHTEVVALGGFGVPTLVFERDGVRDALFGPVLIDPPSGQKAIELFDLVCGWREFPYLFEMQRPKSPAHLKAIADEFNPYLRARDWQSIQNPTP